MLFRDSRPRSNGFLSIVILLIASAGYISIDLYLPSLPAITTNFTITSGLSQFTVTAFLLSFAFSQLIYGPLSDRYGRKRVLFIGLLIYLIGSIVNLLSGSIAVFLLARFIQGLGIGAGAVLSRVMLRDSYSGNKLARMSSLLNMGVAAVTTAAPALGGFIQQTFGYRGNFTVMLLFGVTVFVILFFIPETNQNKETSTNIGHRYWKVLSNKRFVCNVIISGTALSSLIVYAMTNPFIMQVTLKLSPALYGLIALIIAGSEIIGSFLSGIFVTKWGANKLVLIGISGLLLMGILMVLLGKYLPPNILGVLMPTLVAGVCIGVILPNASANAFNAFTKGIGVVGAAYGFIQLLISTLSTSLSAYFNIHSQWAIGITLTLLSLIALPSYFMSLKGDTR